jgi:MSHA biogenesis protein MshK
MDETLMRRAAPLACMLAACLAAFLTPGAAIAAASASVLQDPTRPPAALSAAPAGAVQIEAAPSLQSVQVGRAADHAQGRSAVIDGESVRVGERFRGARVVRIADNEVELERGRERQVLRLYAAPDDGSITRVKGKQ